MAEPVYVIRGTGTKMDGAVVTATPAHETTGGWYYTTSPVGLLSPSKYPVLIHEKHLQLVENRLKRYTYTFTVTRKCVDDGTVEQDLLIVDNAIRRMKVQTILDRLETELSPILRLE